MDEVVRLEQHVAELGIAQPAVGPFQPALHRLLRQHDVHREMLADVAEEIEEAETAHPVVVVRQDRGDVTAVEVEEPLQLPGHALDVALEDLDREQLPLFAFAAGIANHPRGAAHHGDWPVTGPLEAPKDHQCHEVTDVQTVGRGIESDVHASRPFRENSRQIGIIGRLVDQPAPAEFRENIVHEGWQWDVGNSGSVALRSAEDECFRGAKGDIQRNFRGAKGDIYFRVQTTATCRRRQTGAAGRKVLAWAVP